MAAGSQATRKAVRDAAGYRTGLPQHEPRCSSCKYSVRPVMGNFTQHDLRCDRHHTGVKTHGWCDVWKSRDEKPPAPVQLQINQTGAWRSALDFDLIAAPPELLGSADQMARLAGERVRMRVVMCEPTRIGGNAATKVVLLTWSREEGWVTA